MIYVIVSEHEKGFWNTDDGWVSDINDASRFDQNDKDNLTLPIGAEDVKWLVVVYDW